jgi:hypothetical protein
MHFRGIDRNITGPQHNTVQDARAQVTYWATGKWERLIRTQKQERKSGIWKLFSCTAMRICTPSAYQP